MKKARILHGNELQGFLIQADDGEVRICGSEDDPGSCIISREPNAAELATSYLQTFGFTLEELVSVAEDAVGGTPTPVPPAGDE